VPLRLLSRAAASSLPQNVAVQVDEFNREMEALFGVGVDSREESKPVTQSLPAVSAPASAISCSGGAAGATDADAAPFAASTQVCPQELARVGRLIDDAFAAGDMSDRERRCLRLMLRNSDEQLLRFAVLHQHSPSASWVQAGGLLDVLDERVSHALLQQYRKS
jgi:hypothetical protein